MEKRRRVGRAT